MELLQILWNVYFAVLGAFLSIVMTRVVKQNGTVLKQIQEGFKKMEEGFKGMKEGFKGMDDRAEQRHREVLELFRNQTKILEKIEGKIK